MYISPDNVIKDYSVLCWSAKWLFEPEVMGEKVTGQDAIDRKDADILTEMWKLLNEADIVVVQNGKKFDIPKLNTRFLLAGFPPPMYYQVVDTKEVMAKHFGFSSNKLDYVNGFLGIDGKTEMEFQDWIDCVHGSEEALSKMLSYNKDDVVIMEELYLKLRPWIPAPARFRPQKGQGGVLAFSIWRRKTMDDHREVRTANGLFASTIVPYSALQMWACSFSTVLDSFSHYRD